MTAVHFYPEITLAGKALIWWHEVWELPLTLKGYEHIMFEEMKIKGDVLDQRL